MRTGTGRRALWRALALGGLVGLSAAAADMAWAVTTSGAAPSCERLAAEAAERHGLPPGLMQAVALTETGRTVAGDYRAWPWAINVAGQGHYPASRAEALAMARDLKAQGARFFDLGCMQINYRWHGQAFDSLEHMLDPGTNTDYAARYLAQLRDREGSWDAAIRRYHSGDRDRGEAYLERVRRHMDQIGHTDWEAKAMTAVTDVMQGTQDAERRRSRGVDQAPRDERFAARAPLVPLERPAAAPGMSKARLPEGVLPKPLARIGHPDRPVGVSRHKVNTARLR